MARDIMEGESIYIPFRNGRSINDTKHKARMYRTKEAFQRCFPGDEYGTDNVVLLEYAPVVQGEATKYKALLAMYYELREAFIDYGCSGSCNFAPYCLNRCPECVDKRGWCITMSDHCRGFNPAEVIPWEDESDDDK